MTSEKAMKAVEKFIAKFASNPRVVGIVLSGSHHHGDPDKHSDIDVYIVLDKGKFRERGNTFVDGFEIEYFINPANQVEKYLEEEKKPHVNPCTAHMLSNCKILYQKGRELSKLRAKAKKIIEKEHAKLKSMEVEMAKYGLDDLRKDLDDMYVKIDDFAIMVIGTKILDKCIELFFRIKRKSPDKPKRLRAQLKKLDTKFSKLYSDAQLEPNVEKKVKKLKLLIDYVEKLLGGKRSEEWKLRSRATY